VIRCLKEMTMTTKLGGAALAPISRPNLLFLIGFCAMLGFGCSGGYDTEEAADVCNRDQQGQSSCFNADVMAECISCFEECGSDCSQAETCPLQYHCPD
jgi:hypothetical protein